MSDLSSGAPSGQSVPGNPAGPLPPPAPGPTPAEIGETLDFSQPQVDALLDHAKAHGSNYARKLQVAAADGYKLSERHARDLAALQSPNATQPASATPAETDPVGARDPSEYQINLRGLMDPNDMEAVARLDGNLRETMHAMDFPAHVGGPVAEMMVKSSQQFMALDDAGQKMWLAEQKAALTRLFPNLSEATALADAVMDRIPREDGEALVRYGCLSARVIAQLVLQAKRLGLTVRR